MPADILVGLIQPVLEYLLVLATTLVSLLFINMICKII